MIAGMRNMVLIVDMGDVDIVFHLDTFSHTSARIAFPFLFIEMVPTKYPSPGAKDVIERGVKHPYTPWGQVRPEMT